MKEAAHGMAATAKIDTYAIPPIVWRVMSGLFADSFAHACRGDDDRGREEQERKAHETSFMRFLSSFVFEQNSLSFIRRCRF